MLLLAIEKVTESVCVFVKYWAEEELVSRPDGTVLKVVETPTNGEKYLAW